MPEFDVVGVGLNATDTLLVVPRFPAYGGKVPFEEEIPLNRGESEEKASYRIRVRKARHRSNCALLCGDGSS